MPIKDLDKFWSLEEIGIANEDKDITKEEFEAQKLQDSLTFYNKEEQTWYTGLLFKSRPPELHNNKGKAMAILRKVEKSAIDKGYTEVLNQAYQELVDNGFAEEIIEDQEPKDVHYLPGHPVFKEDRETMKTRIVLNASSVTTSGKSLNDCLYQGQCLLPDIVHVLIRFRMNPAAFVLDISKMFLRIKLHQDKDYLRFLWRNCDTSVEPKILRMKAVSFGIVSSPYQAIDVVMKHADMLEDRFPMAAQEVREQIYMDDVPGGDDNPESAKTKLEEIQEFFKEANMQPHKFASNIPEILENISEEVLNPKEIIKVLGVLWNTKTDVITFNITPKETASESDTKRSFLELSASIYDPLGMLSPFIMKIKLLFQEVWLQEMTETKKKKKGWDTKLPEEIQKKWNDMKSEIPSLNAIETNRCFFTAEEGKPLAAKLFAFGDASNQAYATAIYIVGIHGNGSVSSNLVFSRTRVAPLKMISKMETKQSIVRLELLAALITARAVRYVQKALEKKVEIKEIYCFTDSLINLCRIRKGPERYKLWVANRLTEILTLTTNDQWRHCPGPLNPADHPSRGLSVDELKLNTLVEGSPIHQTGSIRMAVNSRCKTL